MNPTTATFDNTTKVLVTAWLNGTLLKGHCCACAVGNICAAALGYKVTDIQRGENLIHLDAQWADCNVDSAQWRLVFMTTIDGKQSRLPMFYRGEAAREIDATGYTWEELARIEHTFEQAMPGIYSEEAEYAGLMAVVEVLADIHGVDLTTAEAAKAMFVRA
jgi:hypothetical protein